MISKTTFTLTLLSALIGSLYAADTTQPSQARQAQNPGRVSIALPTRDVKDRNGNTIFKAPVPLQSKEVAVTPRQAPKVQPIGSKFNKQQPKLQVAGPKAAPKPNPAVKQQPNKAKPRVNAVLQRAREERAKIKAKKQAKIIEAKAHVFKEPSKEYVESFKWARVNVFGSLNLMLDTVKVLFDKYPNSCRILTDDPTRKSDVGRLVCENTPVKVKNGKLVKTIKPFGDGVVRIFFQYLISNDLLVGADFEFKTEKDSVAKFKELANAKPVQEDFFVEEGSKAIDSPFWRVSHGNDFGRYWARIATNFDEGQFVEDEKEKRKAENLRLGTLELHRTQVSDMPETTADCRLLGIDREENMYEYYGKCFGFKGLAHYQLNFNYENRLETAILRPDSIGALSDMSSYLADRFGVGKRCRISQGDAIRILVKEDITALDFKFSYVAPSIPEANVYAGTCDRPFIYETPRRLYFTNKAISDSKLDDSYRKRKLRNQARIERKADREIRKSGIRDYFGQ